MESVGPSATLIRDDVEATVRRLKDELPGEIEVGGPDLARSLAEFGLIDQYRIYLHPAVVGAGKPCFAEPSPPLRLVVHDRIGEDAIRLIYVPA